MFNGQEVKKKVYRPVALHTPDSASRSKNSPDRGGGDEWGAMATKLEWVLAYGHAP